MRWMAGAYPDENSCGAKAQLGGMNCFRRFDPLALLMTLSMAFGRLALCKYSRRTSRNNHPLSLSFTLAHLLFSP
jgi:hypothetical protein